MFVCFLYKSLERVIPMGVLKLSGDILKTIYTNVLIRHKRQSDEGRKTFQS